MKVISAIIIVLACFLSSFHVASAESVEGWINRVKWIDEGEKAITKDETQIYIDEATVYIKEGVNNPVFYYFRGRLGFLMRGHYHRALLKEGKKYRLDAPENQALIREYQFYYRKALDLDDRPDAPAHLTAEMLGTMADDVLAAPDIKQRALEKEMELARAGKVQTENENYEWELSEFLLAAHAERKDYEAYLKTVNEMIKRFPNSPRMNELLEYKRQAEAAIAKRDREAAKESGERK